MSKAEKKVGMWNCGLHTSLFMRLHGTRLKTGLTPYRSVTGHELYSYLSETVPF